MTLPVYGSSRAPATTTQPWVPLRHAFPVMSRLRMSLRVSQPLWSTSDHAAPNCSREYPVFGARPLIARLANATSALEDPSATGDEGGDAAGDSDPAAGVVVALLGRLVVLAFESAL